MSKSVPAFDHYHFLNLPNMLGMISEKMRPPMLLWYLKVMRLAMRLAIRLELKRCHAYNYHW